METEKIFVALAIVDGIFTIYLLLGDQPWWGKMVKAIDEFELPFGKKKGEDSNQILPYDPYQPKPAKPDPYAHLNTHYTSSIFDTPEEERRRKREVTKTYNLEKKKIDQGFYMLNWRYWTKSLTLAFLGIHLYAIHYLILHCNK